MHCTPNNYLVLAGAVCVCVCACRACSHPCHVQYPLLSGFYKRVAQLPGIKEYLASPLRLDKVNGNGMG